MAARVFMSYSHKDEALRNELEVQLAVLKREGLIEVWHDRRMVAGDQFDASIEAEMDSADVVLLLVSPDFLASDYCFNIEKTRALERHRRGEARLISVILRPCDWQNTDLRELLATPTDGRPVTRWPDRDEAFLNVATEIRRAINEIGKAAPRQPQLKQNHPEAPVNPEPRLPRSSNLRLKREFTQSEKDDFVIEAFEFMDQFFGGSLWELQGRNPEVGIRHRRVDGNTFTATIYRNGERVSGCTVRLGGFIGNGSITFSYGDDASSTSINDSMSVEADDQKLYLAPMGMQHPGNRSSALSFEGAAEYYWALLIQPLQGN